MPTVLWTGRLSWPTRLLADAGNAHAWITGSARDTATMKQRMKLGYEGACSDHVSRYDDLGREHYTRIATALLEGVDLRSRQVLDVGGGTGVLSLLALERGAARVVCGDQSLYMLHRCRAKAAAAGHNADRVAVQLLDAERLPFADNSFQAVLSSMLLGLVPDQARVVAEMARVVQPGGAVALSTHGPELYWQASDAMFRAVPKRYVLGYRLEFWPRDEAAVAGLLSRAGLVEVRTRRITWQDEFPGGGEAYDFFAATSSSWWFSKLPRDRIADCSQRLRDYFERKAVKRITADIILARGRKPE